MSREIDERVVSMQFDNQHFEKNVQTSLSTIDKLKRSLNLTGATKGLENVGDAARRVDMSPLNNAVQAVGQKFSSMQVIAITALANITNSAVNAGKRIVSSLTIDPVKMGFNEYELKMGSIQTIMAGTGESLETVNKYLNELNEYSDKTIYSFQDMTSNIGKFTNAGVSLEDSVMAIKGVSNVAAVSGANANEASRAMYNFAQALSSGYVKLIDWKSIENANMATVEFKNYLLEAAAAQGTLKKNTDGTYTTLEGKAVTATKGFNDSLQDQWMTSEVLISTLKQYSDETTEIGKKAAAAATEVKTLSQLYDTLKESAQSGWAQTWEIIVGDFEEAKAILSQLNDVIGGFIGDSADARNELLLGWKDLGGRDALIESVKNAFNGLLSVIKPVKEAFSEIFPPITSEQLFGFTTGLKNLTEKFKLSDTASANLKRTFKGLFAVVDIIKQAFTAVVKAGASLFDIVLEIGGGVLNVTGSFGDWLVSLRKSAKESDIFNKVLKGVVDIIRSAYETLKTFLGVIKEKFASPGIKVFRTLLDSVSDKLSGVSNAAGSMKDGIISSFEAIGNALKNSAFMRLLDGLFIGLAKIGSEAVKVLGSIVGGIVNKIFSGDLQGIMDFLNSLIAGGLGVGLIKFIKNLKNPLDGVGGFLENITGILDNVRGCFEEYQNQLKAGSLMKIAQAIAILAASLLVLSFIDADKLGVAVGAITVLFTELIGVMSIIDKLDIKEGLFGISAAMISISTGMLLLAAATKILSTMSWKEMGVGLISLTTGLGAMVGAVNLLPKDGEINAAALAIKKMSTAMIILAVAIKILSTMSWKEMGVGLISLGVGLGVLVAAIKFLPKDTAVRASGLIGLAASLVILSGALKIMSTMSLEEMVIGLTALSGGLSVLVIAVNSLPKDTAVRASGLIGLAASLAILAGVLKIIATMSIEDLEKGLVTIAASLIGFAISLRAMNGTIGGSAALLVAVAALAAFTPVLFALGSIGLLKIVTGLAAIAGVFAIIGAAGTLLAPTVPVIAALSGSIALLGLGILAMGAGLTAFGTGLASLAAGFTAIAGSLGVIVVGIVKIVEAFVVGVIKGIGNGIIVFCEVIAEGVPVIGEAIKSVILTVCDILVECVPEITNTIFEVIIGLLKSLSTFTPQLIEGLFTLVLSIIKGLATHIPDFVKSLGDILMSVFTGVIDSLKSVDPDALIKGILAVGLMAGVMAALAAVALLVPGAMAGVLGMGLVIAELSLVLAAIGALAQIPGLDWLINEGGKLLGSIGTAIGNFIGGIIGGIAKGITSSLPQIGTDLSNFMTNLQPFIDGAARIDSSSLESVKSLAGVILALTGANIIDSLTSWFTGGSSLVKFGEDLAAFAPHFKAYADTVSGIDPTVITASATAAKALAEMASHIPNTGGIAAWFAGDNSISKFGDDLVALGKGIKGFSESVGELNSESIVAAANSAKTLAEMTNHIPNTGGVAAWFAGENSISNFSTDLVTLGKGLKKFSTEVTGITPESIMSAANAAKALAEMTGYIPNVGGVAAWFTGENSISKFAGELPKLGKGLKNFSAEVNGVDPEGIVSAANAAKALAEMTGYIPKENGIKAWFTGETSIAKFADKLPKLGEGIKGFSQAVVGVNVESLSAASSAAKAIAEMTGNTIKDVSKIPTLATNLEKLGTGMKSCFSKLGGITAESISTTKNVINAVEDISKLDGGKTKSVANSLEDLTKSIKNLANVPKNATSNFSKALSDMGKASADSLVKSFKNVEPDMKKAGQKAVDEFISGLKGKLPAVSTACKSIISECKTAIGDTKKTFTSAGSNLVSGFAAGISENSYKAEAKARAMAKAAAKAAEEALDINSPSKVGYGIGNFFGLGFVNAIDDNVDTSYRAGSDMGNSAKKGLSDAISKIRNIIDGDIDLQPTIRPVLDLSEVRSGADSINSLFETKSSVGLLAKVGSISSLMRQHDQNGDTNLLASEISKLRKDLLNVDRASYTINGITYDDGSNISEAVRQLIRAAQVDRRL